MARNKARHKSTAVLPSPDVYTTVVHATGYVPVGTTHRNRAPEGMGYASFTYSRRNAGSLFVREILERIGYGNEEARQRLFAHRIVDCRSDHPDHRGHRNS